MSNLNADDRIAVLQIESADMRHLQKALSLSRHMIKGHLSLIEDGKTDLKALTSVLCQVVQTLDVMNTYMLKSTSQIEAYIMEMEKAFPMPAKETVQEAL